jgi:hypothetical protein
MKINSNLPAINGFQEFKTELEGLLDLASTNGGVATAPFDVIYSADGISLRQDGVDKWLVGPSERTAGVVDRAFLSKNSIPTSLSDRTVVKSSSMTFSAVKGAVPVSFSTVRYFSLSDPNVFVSGGPFSPISSYVANTALGGPGTIICRRLWNNDNASKISLLRDYISELRKILKADTSLKIRSSYGKGYCFSTPEK